MKIGHHKQMMSFLTRPDTRSKKERKLMESKQTAAEMNRKNKKRKEYGLEPIIPPERFVKEYNLYDAEPGGEMIVGPNGQIMMAKDLKNKFEKEVENKTKELSEDKIVTKQRPVYPKEATPEQVGQLAERLERSRQMTGAKPTTLKEVNKRFGAMNKKKKAEAMKLDFKPLAIDPIISDHYSALPPERDPILEELEKKVMANKEKNYQEKVKNNSSGLRYFAPLEVKRDD
jgi:hypothetical protein